MYKISNGTGVLEIQSPQCNRYITKYKELYTLLIARWYYEKSV